jgi:ribonuclease R
MPERYVSAILKYLSEREYRPLKPRQLARQMGVSSEDYGTFREAVKRLRDAGRVVMGSGNALTLPQMSAKVVGFFRANPRGFGFVVPETPNAHGDLYVPPEATAGALSGDRVLARARKRGKRGGQTVYSGEIVQILQRGRNRFVGTLERTDDNWFVLPDGAQMTTPIVVRDVPADAPDEGTKVVVEIVQYARRGELPSGVIVERLGPRDDIEAETLAVIRAHGLDDTFSEQALADARDAVARFDPDHADGREDLTHLTVVTIDPETARDFDDAVSLSDGGDGTTTLGVHIADVSHFVAEGTALDGEARGRATSVYFIRKVVPMLPEILSNGVCSLQEGQRRFCKSVFITYDAGGNVVRRRFAETVIRSTRRLTYKEAQLICDGKTGGFDADVVALVQAMERLARRIEARRRRAGMIHLDLPEVEVVLSEEGKVVDAVPEDQSYSHTIIEMLMVEANEVVAGALDRLDRRFLRRIHPDPDPLGARQLSTFVRACGYKLARDLTRRDIQNLLASVKGRPESYAVNLAVLRTFQQAEYSPRSVGHFALASNSYCHFTSPIRRYPDLTVHRLVGDLCRGRLRRRPPEDVPELVRLGEQCTAAERRAEAAENELRDVLVLQYLSTRVGEEFDGVITGVTSFGIFVELTRYLIEGLVRLEDLGDDWWDVSARYGTVRGEVTGRTYRIGDMLGVRIAQVNVPARQLNLVLQKQPKARKPGKRKRRKKRGS